MSRRKIDAAALAGWFSFQPVARAVGEAAGVPSTAWPEREPTPRYAPEPTT
jgi:hypothetical protein